MVSLLCGCGGSRYSWVMHLHLHFKSQIDSWTSSFRILLVENRCPGFSKVPVFSSSPLASHHSPCLTAGKMFLSCCDAKFTWILVIVEDCLASPTDAILAECFTHCAVKHICVGMQFFKSSPFVTTGISHRKTLIEMIGVWVGWRSYCGLALFKVVFVNNNNNYVLWGF